MASTDQIALNEEEVARATLTTLVMLFHELTGVRIEFVRMPDGRVAATHRTSEPSVILGTTAKPNLGI